MSRSTSNADELQRWTILLERSLALTGGFARSVTVVAETDSTQDEARRRGAAPGEVVVALRQTSGRGRLGRSWADSLGEGVAMTVVAEPGPPERLAIASAVGAAMTAELMVGRSHRVGIKWPNDIIVSGRKLAGILIEQTRQAALIGVGLNVLQVSWPPELQDKAVSLAQLALPKVVTRLEAAVGLLLSLSEALTMPEGRLARAFADRDVLIGTSATFRSGEKVWSGLVRRIDPMAGLLLEVAGEEIWLPAATTTMQDR